MKLYIYICVLLFTAKGFGQDYFAIVKKNDSVTYNYPPYAKIKLIGPDGKTKIIGKDESIDVRGDYRLEIDVPWRDEPEIIEAEGGLFEIFVLPQNIRDKNGDYYAEKSVERERHKVRTDAEKVNSKPRVTYRDVTESKQNPGQYNLLIVFDNDMVFRYNNGEARAWQNSDEIAVTGKYLVKGKKFLLKISFDPKDAETWWVFDRVQK